jgi:hypothetical protein
MESWREISPVSRGLSSHRNGAAMCRPLLEALDDPERFAVATCMLPEYTPGPPFAPPRSGPSLHRDLGQGRVDIDTSGGLRLRIPAGRGWKRDPFVPDPRIGRYDYEGPAVYDPAQIPRVRDFWFERFARPVASAPFWTLASALAFPPFLWLATRSRRLYARRRRRSLGLCPRCGYDLRGNASGRCSECGTVVRKEAAT